MANPQRIDAKGSIEFVEKHYNPEELAKHAKLERTDVDGAGKTWYIFTGTLINPQTGKPVTVKDPETGKQVPVTYSMISGDKDKPFDTEVGAPVTFHIPGQQNIKVARTPDNAGTGNDAWRAYEKGRLHITVGRIEDKQLLEIKAEPNADGGYRVISQRLLVGGAEITQNAVTGKNSSGSPTSSPIVSTSSIKGEFNSTTYEKGEDHTDNLDKIRAAEKTLRDIGVTNVNLHDGMDDEMAQLGMLKPNYSFKVKGEKKHEGAAKADRPR